ncbi:DNA polymerase IV [Pseudorhodoplanes sp.]|uniref:DNA polymerase IV n=1 Tax=Pseudorhodoplanes sp. TaxID=1934341 RepID=UPI002CC72D45|nr:DNA polymerase IV [Pseudorhodoplanes sp.]HWV53324.1 DNA polymerase IV [Pseudorhodoplanes sp.]
MGAFCRDCLADAASGPRCAACGSPRLARHPEIDTLTVAHVDCDAFYATIEKRDDPSIADKPLIVGGGTRGVVSTACYIARTYGVHSAMPMFKARRLCPDAVVIKPNMAKYVAVARQVRERMRELTPLVEPVSIDEAFLDLTGTERLHGRTAAQSLARFASSIEREIGITVSIGLSYNKFLAKIASDLDKPRGFAMLGRAEAPTFLADKPISIIFGVGKVSQERLARDGLRTIADIQKCDEVELMRRLGAEGQRLSRLARGIDHRKVVPDRDAKSVSAETTFDTDVAAFRPLEKTLWDLSERVSARLKASGVSGSTVTLKLKTADFQTRTRARSLGNPTQLARRIFDCGRELLEKEIDGTKFRLIGIGVSNLQTAEAADPDDLLNQGARKAATSERAVDALRAKYGRDAIKRGLALDDGG